MASQAMTLALKTITRLLYSDSGGAADIVCPFAPDGWTFFIAPLNSEPVFFSFDGVHDNGILIPGTSSPHSYGVTFQSVWFRRENNDAATKPSEVYAEASLK